MTLPRFWKKPPLFLDRDGTLIEEVNYLSSLDQMRLLPGAAAAVRQANQAGLPVIVVTNQSGVARGYITEAFVRRSAVYLRELLAGAGAHLDGHYYCPFLPEGLPPYDQDSPDRKPGAGMLIQAAAELNLQLEGAYMVGDKQADLDTGAEFGVIPVLIRTGYGRKTELKLKHTFSQRGGRVFEDLAEAMPWILKNSALKNSGFPTDN